MSDLVLPMSKSEPDHNRVPSFEILHRSATTVGSLSILLWATWPSLALLAAPTPTFEVLAVGQLVGAATLALIRVVRGKSLSGMIPRKTGMLFFGLLGVFGTNTLNFLAITRIPAAQASMINYTWPIVALLLSGILQIARLSYSHYSAIFCGFVGVLLIISPWESLQYDIFGILMALAAALCYASYTIYRQLDHSTPSEAVAIYNIIAAIFCSIIHFCAEKTQTMTLTQFFATIALGIAPMGLGYALWDYGVARGDARLMTILAYGTPLFATMILIALGLAAFSVSLVAGASLIILGAFLGSRKNDL